MTPSKSLPVRPSLESLRKQAKKLARDVAAGNADAVARARNQLPKLELPLSQRDAQLVLAREYGFPGWRELTAEALARVGKGLDWAAAEAHHVIHDNNVERLKQLLVEYPALVTWRDEDGGLLRSATQSYGDSFDPFREQHFTRRECAELLLDAGAVVDASVWENALQSRSKGTLELLQRKAALPRALNLLIALGDHDGVRSYFDERGALRVDARGNGELATLNLAFIHACRFEDEPIATFLLDRLIAVDPDLGARIESWQGRAAFVKYLIAGSGRLAGGLWDGSMIVPWHAFVMHQVVRAIHEGEQAAFVRWLQQESWVLGEAFVRFQVEMIEQAILKDRPDAIARLFDLEPAVLQRRPPPRSGAVRFAFVYAKAHLVPLITRIWPLPDDLPTAAGMGDLERVKRWFDADGKPALGNPAHHMPENTWSSRFNAAWPPTTQSVLDTALGWACMNTRLEVADFLLQHGADINTKWSSHEPASILHELVSHANYESMQFLIDRGIDMTIVDSRWGGTAAGWAYHAANDPKMCDWLLEAEKIQKKPG
jgi:hypothetical protein